MNFIKKLLCGTIATVFLCGMSSIKALDTRPYIEELKKIVTELESLDRSENLPSIYKRMQKLFFLIMEIGTRENNENLLIIFKDYIGCMNIPMNEIRRGVSCNVCEELIYLINYSVKVALDYISCGRINSEDFEEVLKICERIDSDSCKVNQLKDVGLYKHYYMMKLYMFFKFGLHHYEKLEDLIKSQVFKNVVDCFMSIYKTCDFSSCSKDLEDLCEKLISSERSKVLPTSYHYVQMLFFLGMNHGDKKDNENVLKFLKNNIERMNIPMSEIHEGKSCDVCEELIYLINCSAKVALDYISYGRINSEDFEEILKICERIDSDNGKIDRLKEIELNNYYLYIKAYMFFKIGLNHYEKPEDLKRTQVFQNVFNYFVHCYAKTYQCVEIDSTYSYLMKIADNIFKEHIDYSCKFTMHKIENSFRLKNLEDERYILNNMLLEFRNNRSELEIPKLDSSYDTPYESVIIIPDMSANGRYIAVPMFEEFGNEWFDGNSQVLKLPYPPICQPSEPDNAPSEEEEIEAPSSKRRKLAEPDIPLPQEVVETQNFQTPQIGNPDMSLT